LTLPAEAFGADVSEVLADIPETLRWEVGIVARRMAADRRAADPESIRVLYAPASDDAPARLLGIERIDAATEQGLAGVWWLPRGDRPGALVGAGDVDYERLLWQSPIDYRQISRGIGNATRRVRRKVTARNAKGERVTRVRVVRVPVAHIGVDMSAPTGTPIHAVSDATVAFAGRRGAFGNLVILDHGQGYQTYYAHLSAFAEDLTVGRVVPRGQVVGLVGATGRATGPHLHFEVRQDGRYVDPFDDTHQIPVWGLQPDEASTVLLRALALRAAGEGTALPGAGCAGSDILTLN
jgi:murein DD-endopeptidase MepM/ murein hydrolase activator NlpD